MGQCSSRQSTLRAVVGTLFMQRLSGEGAGVLKAAEVFVAILKLSCSNR